MNKQFKCARNTNTEETVEFSFAKFRIGFRENKINLMKKQFVVHFKKEYRIYKMQEITLKYVNFKFRLKLNQI